MTTAELIDITASTGSGDWREKALCTQVPGDVWFPEGGENPRAAKRICGWCEVQAECLAFALKTNEQHGIWGGLSARERRALRASQRRALRLVEGEAA